MKPFLLAVPAVLAVLLGAGCASAPANRPALKLASHVDLARFMGDWFVIANIPTFLERGAHNAKDSYRLAADGTIETTYSYNADAPDGPRRQIRSRGFVLDETSNAVWGQQYVWPFEADYRIAYLSPDYDAVVVAREKRDYVWIMARTPTLPEARLAELIAFVGTQGYDVARIRRAPQAVPGP